MCYTSEVATYTPYITAFGGIFFGAMGSYFVGVKLAKKNHANAIAMIRQQESDKAASEFRAAFAPAVFKFQIASDVKTIEKMLKEELIAQGMAIEKFRPYVKNKQWISGGMGKLLSIAQKGRRF